ncbi:MAG TPA: biotin--[acetyl-CoA-carboxylase] ligase [Bryobacterales bacterium]|nr:biotin--[acetyl-CoA-carboxylase] ligase [Bryobacterales bacterium]
MAVLNLSLLEQLGHPIHYFASIDTTMRAAAELAERGEPAGAVVIAEEQTAGRGRLGRSWISEPEAGLYFSLILRPALAASDAAVVTLALGLAAGRAIHRLAGMPCDLRWPNDVLLTGRKCCGILTEMVAEADRVRYIVAGIGVNVNHAALPAAIAETATSLRLSTGCEYAREALLAEVLKEVDRYLDILAQRGPAAVVELFTRASSYACGKRVVVVNGSEQITGSTAGITAAGTLLLRRDDGAVAPILAGSVRLAPE